MTNAWDTAIAAVSANVRNRWKLDELEGTTASDTGTGTVRDGTIGSAVLLGRGNTITQSVNRRACMEFPDAANGQIDADAWTMPSGDFSLAFWIRFDDVAAQQYIFSHGTGTTTDYIHVLLNGGDLEVRARVSNTGVSCDDITTTYAADTWYFIVYTLTGTTQKLYVNGVDVTRTNSDTLGAISGTSIGGYAGDTTSRVNGLMQDVIVFDDDLTAQEVSDLYAARIPAQAISHDDWDDKSGLTITGTATDWTAANHQLTVTNTGATTATTAANTVSTTERWVTAFDINPDGGAGYTFRVELLDNSTTVALIAFDATTLSLDTDGGSLTGVTPSNWDHDAEQRVIIVGDPATNTAYFWLLHVDTLTNDQYDYLGSVSMASTPDRIQFDVGSTAGTTVITSPLGVWRCTDTIATMGDSLATGSPLYSPVPRWIANSPKAPTNQLAWWYAGDKYSDRETFVVNFGQGGQGADYVRLRTAWFEYLDPAVSLLMVGTNDINGGTSAEDVISDLNTITTDIIGDSVPLVFCTIVARPNASDPDDHEAERATVNAWIKSSGISLGARYIDADKITVDPADNQSLLAKYDADTVHLTPIGARDVAQGDVVDTGGPLISRLHYGLGLSLGLGL